MLSLHLTLLVICHRLQIDNLSHQGLFTESLVHFISCLDDQILGVIRVLLRELG